jgi:serine/threonine-protein kinase
VPHKEALAPTVIDWMPLPNSGAPMSSAPPSDPLKPFGLEPGTLVDRTYRVERVLGVGGMGVVALATDERLERSVAIKFIRPELFAFPEMRTFFLNEGRAMARVQHPNVLSIHAFGEHEGTPYFVMELVPGKTVDQWLRSRPTQFPDLDEAVRISEQACLGVQAIHAAKLVHRDLKPSNLLLDDAGHVTVADLGVARILESATNGNVIVGSSHYMAPEAALGEDESPETAARRDVYSLGCIAYELVTGRPPFLGQTDMSVLSQHVLESPLPPSAFRPDLPDGYDEVILSALVKEPLHRCPSAAELRAALLAEHSGSRDPERILVADDDPDWREIIGGSLSARFPHAQIDYVDDGEEALTAFERKPYSVVLVDLEMPTMDGARLTQLLRGLGASERTPIIVLTAAGGPKEWQRLSSMGADAFLVKPVNAEDVELVIRRTLRSRRQMVPSQPRPSLPSPTTTKSG